jgi:hypothetical protein
MNMGVVETMRVGGSGFIRLTMGSGSTLSQTRSALINFGLKFQVLTTTSTKMVVFRDVAPMFQVISLMMEAIKTSQTSFTHTHTRARARAHIYIYQTQWISIPKDRHVYLLGCSGRVTLKF